MLLVKPYTNKIQNYNKAINEFFLLIFYLVEILNELKLYTITLEELATFSIRVILATMCFNILMNVYDVINLIITKVKSRCYKKNVEVLPVNKTTLEANTGKLFDE